MSTLDEALRICARYPVFPCRGDNKRPCTPHGFKDAVSEPSAVVDLWRQHPGQLVGVPTGEVSGFDVLDVDPRHDGHIWLQEAEDSLPLTRRHDTRSGGVHILFRHAKGVRNTESRIAPGVDTRGDGGYVIWWPAHSCPVTHPETWDDWPTWLLRILVPAPKKYIAPPMPATKVEANTRAALMVDRAFGRVRGAAPGQRHYELRAAAATIGGLLRFIPADAPRLQQQLVELVMETGAEDRANAEKTAAWAMEKGRASPLLMGR